MSIVSFIKKVCVQPAVYWGNPVNDGYGSFVYDDPVEIKCRWEDKQKTISKDDGTEFVAIAEILVTDELQMGGCLRLGSISEINQNAHPSKIANTYKIMGKAKTPLFRSNTKFVHLYYIGFQNRSNQL